MISLADFVLRRLADDERRFAEGELPLLDEAERRGRISVLRTDDGAGLLINADPVRAQEERVPVPFPEKVESLRREARDTRVTDVLALVASVYDTHPEWHEHWRP